MKWNWKWQHWELNWGMWLIVRQLQCRLPPAACLYGILHVLVCCRCRHHKCRLVSQSHLHTCTDNGRDNSMAWWDFSGKTWRMKVATKHFDWWLKWPSVLVTVDPYVCMGACICAWLCMLYWTANRCRNHSYITNGVQLIQVPTHTHTHSHTHHRTTAVSSWFHNVSDMWLTQCSPCCSAQITLSYFLSSCVSVCGHSVTGLRVNPSLLLLLLL